MAQDIQIRPELIKAGYADSDIGYDAARKMTTLKGQDFIGKDNYTNIAGSTFTDRQNFDTALNKYKQGQQLNDVSQQLFNPTPYVNPLDQQISDLMAMFQQRVTNPTQVDPYSTPQYAAAQAQVQQSADRGIRSAQESLGSAGFGRSTTLADNAQRVQNDADQHLQTQMLPQIIQQLQAIEQQKTQGIYDSLNQLMNQQGVHDTRHNAGQDRLGQQLDYLTGRQDRAQDIQREDSQINRANFESDRAYNFAVGQQEWDNNFKSGQFDFQKAQQIWDNNFQNKSFQQSMNDAAASRGLQWASLNQRDKEFVADQAFRDQQFTYQKAMDEASVWQKTREMDLAEKKLGQTTTAAYNEAMQKAIDAALKDPSYVSAKDTAAKDSIIDGYYKQLTSGIGMTDAEISQYLK